MSPEKIPPTSRSPGTNASGYTCSGMPCRQPMASSVLRKYGTSGKVAPGQTYPEALANRLNVAPPWPIIRFLEAADAVLGLVVGGRVIAGLGEGFGVPSADTSVQGLLPVFA